jgi:hypothetical protein
MHLQAAREPRVRRLHVLAHAQHAAPAERVDDQRRRDVAAVGVHGAAGASLDLGDVELGVAGLREQQLAQQGVVEGREGPRQRPASGQPRCMHEQRPERLADRVVEPQMPQPRRRRSAGGRLTLPDLVAIEHQHPRSAATKLTSHRQPGERGTTDEDIGVGARSEGSALGAALRGTDWHS